MRSLPGAVAVTSASVILLMLAFGAALGIVVLAMTPPDMDALRELPRNTWWFLYQDAPGSPTAAWRIGAAVIASLVSFVAVQRAHVDYRRVRSPVIPFVMMFLLSLGLECLRAGTALLFAADGSISLSVLLTRVIYWGRFVGLFGLLLAGLYGLELKYTRFMVLAGLAMLVSFAMAAYIPVDRTMFLAQLTWKLGDEQSVWFLTVALEALAIATCVAAAVTRKTVGGVRLAIAVALCVATREIQFFAVQPAPAAAGLAAQVAASVLFVSSWAGEARSTPRRPAG